MSEIKTKACPGCKRDLELSRMYFFVRKTTKDGFHNRCRECDGKSFAQPKVIAKEGYKICSKCGIELLCDNFGICKQNVDGLHGQCKECVAIYMGQWRDDNREINTVKRKLRYDENREVFINRVKIYQSNNVESVVKRRSLHYIKNKVSIGIERKIYQNKNKDNIREYHRRYNFKNKDIISEHNKEYHKSHPGAARIRNQRRRAREKKLLHTFTNEQWGESLLYFDNKCCFCDRETKLTMEHIYCVASGGEFTRQNITPSCFTCNSSKHTREPFEWFREQLFYSPEREQKILSYLGYKNNRQQLALF